MRLRLLAAAELDADSVSHALGQLGILFFKAEHGCADSLLRAGRIVLVPAAAALPDLEAGLAGVACWMAEPVAREAIVDARPGRPDPTPDFAVGPARSLPPHIL